MGINDNELLELTQSWEKLRIEIQRNKKFEFKFFENTFSKTYTLLTQNALETTIDKSYLELIVNASLFAKGEYENIDYIFSAALVLTERMLHHVLFDTSGSQEVSVYILDQRKEVLIDFNNIADSINKLSALFEDFYWKKMQF